MFPLLSLLTGLLVHSFFSADSGVRQQAESLRVYSIGQRPMSWDTPAILALKGHNKDDLPSSALSGLNAGGDYKRRALPYAV